MIKEFVITNNTGQSYRLELSNPWESGVIIKSVDGLTPTKATINTNDIATSDGSIYNSARQSQRNIVFKFRLLEDAGDGLIETTRQKLYRIFPEKKKVHIRVKTDNRNVTTEGYVESNEPNIFSKEEEQSVSIICPNAFWTAPSTTYKLNGIEDMFEFPFSNESLTEDLICLGNIIYSAGTTFLYEGDVDSGIIISIHAIGQCINPSVYNIITKEIMTFNTTKIGAIVGDGKNYMDSGDSIICSTVDGDPYVTFIRNGVEYNGIATLPKVSDWLKVQNGYNAFGYKAESGAANIQINIQTQILYGGV